MEMFGNQEFYTFNGVDYVSTFPQEWASNHLPETGPVDCLNCKKHGSLCGVFVMYCTNCAVHEYAGQRGLGAYFPCTENTFMELYNINKEDPSMMRFIQTNGYVSASTSYLKNVPIEAARFAEKTLHDYKIAIEEEEDDADSLPDLITFEEAMRTFGEEDDPPLSVKEIARWSLEEDDFPTVAKAVEKWGQENGHEEAMEKFREEEEEEDGSSILEEIYTWIAEDEEESI